MREMSVAVVDSRTSTLTHPVRGTNKSVPLGQGGTQLATDSKVGKLD